MVVVVGQGPVVGRQSATAVEMTGRRMSTMVRAWWWAARPSWSWSRGGTGAGCKRAWKLLDEGGMIIVGLVAGRADDCSWDRSWTGSADCVGIR